MSLFGTSEGLNGHYFDPEADACGLYDEPNYRPRRAADPFWYHSLIPLSWVETNQTAKAVLFYDGKGEFWVPKKLIKTDGTGRRYIWTKYQIRYLNEETSRP